MCLLAKRRGGRRSWFGPNSVPERSSAPDCGTSFRIVSEQHLAQPLRRSARNESIRALDRSPWGVVPAAAGTARSHKVGRKWPLYHAADTS